MSVEPFSGPPGHTASVSCRAVPRPVEMWSICERGLAAYE